MTAWIGDRAVTLDSAAKEAARLLRASRMPVIAGLATDVAGARAAIILAEKLRGAYDHVASDALLRDLDVMRQAGLMITTATESRARADCVLMVGAGLSADWPDMLKRLELDAPARFDTEQAQRTIIRLGAGRNEAAAGVSVDIAATASGLPQTLACLRAQVAGRATRQSNRSATQLGDVAARLKAARFGVAVWSADSLDALAIEMLAGLIRDLNQVTRFSGLPLAAPMNGNGVLQTSAWMTGFPMRTGFGRGFPEHDTWRFDATRMVETGEADIALWISAFESQGPAWQRQVPLIALAAPATRISYPPNVRIDIGTPGIDHDGVEHAMESGTFTVRHAQAPSDAASAGAVLHLIDKYISEGEESC
jgi:formylmethanofuran dehydrogenase subunit B